MNLFSIGTPHDTLFARYIVNAAGVHADEVAEMIGDRTFRITPRRGEYLVLDKNMGTLVSHVIFQCPTKMGKGVLVSPTVDGNLLTGPNAVDVEDKFDASTTSKGLQDVQEYVRYSIPTMTMGDVITSFAGLRAHGDRGDFIIGPSEANARFIHVAGIESPGLTASPATAEYVVELLREQGLLLTESQSFSPVRKGPVRFHQLTRTKGSLLQRTQPMGISFVVVKPLQRVKSAMRSARPPARAMWMASSGAPVRAWAAAREASAARRCWKSFRASWASRRKK